MRGVFIVGGQPLWRTEERRLNKEKGKSLFFRFSTINSKNQNWTREKEKKARTFLHCDYRVCTRKALKMSVQ